MPLYQILGKHPSAFSAGQVIACKPPGKLLRNSRIQRTARRIQQIFRQGEKTFRRVVEGHFRCKGKFHLHRLADRRRKRFLFLPPRNQRHAFLPGQRKLPLSPGKIHTSGTGRQFGLPAKIFPAGVQFQTAMGKNQSLAL